MPLYGRNDGVPMGQLNPKLWLKIVTSLMFVLVGGVVLLPAVAQADFTFNASTCSVSSVSSVRFRAAQSSFNEEVNVELSLTGSELLLPQLQISFLSQQPLRAAIVWDEIDFERRRQPIYTPRTVDFIKGIEGKSLELIWNTSTQKFQTPLYAFAESQALVALFLAQNNFVLVLETADGIEWRAQHNLAASDSSFRKMAVACYPSQSGSYLGLNGERLTVNSEESKGLSPLALHWSNAYGLLPFGELDSVLPEALKYPAILAKENESEAEKYQLFVEIAKRAKNKIEILERFAVLTSQERYQQLSKVLDAEYEELTESFERLVQLTGTASDPAGLIQDKQDEQERIQTLLGELDNNIRRLQNNLQQTTKNIADTRDVLGPHLLVVKIFQDEQTKRAAEIEKIEAFQASLANWLQEAIVELNETKQSASEKLDMNVWSFEEIEKKRTENAKRASQISAFIELKTQLSELLNSVSDLRRLSKEQGMAAEEYLALALKLSSLQRDYEDTKRWLEEHKSVPHFSHVEEQEFKYLNDNFESAVNLAQEKRDYNVEFDLHAEAYQKAEDKFLASLSKIQFSLPLTSQILCKPEILLAADAKKSPCLFVDQIQDEKTVEAFFFNLSPQNLQSLLGNPAVPWSEPFTKTEIALRTLRSEISGTGFAEIKSSWAELRFVIWRWTTLQKEASAFEVCPERLKEAQFNDSNYSGAFYQAAYSCELEQQNAKLVELQDLRFSVLRLEGDLRTKNTRFETLDRLFVDRSSQFISDSIQKLEQIKDEEDLKRFFEACQIPMEQAEICELSMSTRLEQLTTQIASEKSIYAELTAALVHQIKAKTLEFSGSLKTLRDEAKGYAEQEATYSAENRVAYWISLRDELQAKERELGEVIHSLKNQVILNKDGLKQSEQTEIVLRLEAVRMGQDLAAVTKRIQQLLPEFETYCEQVRPLSAQLRLLDQELYSLAAVEAPRGQALYSSCEQPGLESFSPRREWQAAPRIHPQR